MSEFDFVKPKHFYQDAGDKIKLNWFCYEYANNIYLAISSSKKLSRFRECHPQSRITEFCLYFSKRVRKSVYDMQTGRADGIVFDSRYVYEIYPKSSHRQAQSLLEAALSAWDAQIRMCTGCPNQCLNEGFDLCAMFDNMEKHGWPT